MVCDAFYRIVELSTEKIERCNKLVTTFNSFELEWETNDEGCLKNISKSTQSNRSGNGSKKMLKPSPTIHSPIKKRCKGRPPTKRKQSKVEIAVKTLKKKVS